MIMITPIESSPRFGIKSKKVIWGGGIFMHFVDLFFRNVSQNTPISGMWNDSSSVSYLIWYCDFIYLPTDG